MSKSATEIVEQALTLLDEQITDILDAATTEMSVADIARAVLPQVTRDLIKELPYELKVYLGKSGSLTEESLSDGEAQTGYVKRKVAYTLPTDFWELVSFKLPGWARSVTEYILIDGPGYASQVNPFTRGGKQNPVVAIANKASGTLRLEAYSINSGDSTTPTHFYYVAFDKVPDDAGNNWPDEVFDELTKALASELHVIKERIEQGKLRGEDVLTKLEQH